MLFSNYLKYYKNKEQIMDLLDIFFYSVAFITIGLYVGKKDYKKNIN